jgi:hypothetical protein
MSHQNVIKSKDLYRDGALTIRGHMLTDVDSTPFEAECYDRKDLRTWELGRWTYVGMAVDVEWNGVVIATDSLWGIEHGIMGNGVRANAWQMVPTRTDRAVTTMGTPLSCVIEEAISSAQTFCTSIVPDPVRRSTSPLATSLAAAESWSTTARSPRVEGVDGPAIPLVD